MPSSLKLITLLLCLFLSAVSSLTTSYYEDTCPHLQSIIFPTVQLAIKNEPRMAASLLRLHFHDCFVQGCDASVLLDDTSTFVGEKTAPPNNNSLRGFEIVDKIKQDLEAHCPKIVSCADILAILARDSVVLSGGPGWEVQLGRKDSFSANKTATNSLPNPFRDVEDLLEKFKNMGLNVTDLVALSGAHTIGKARCSLRAGPANQICLASENAYLDTTPVRFDNEYYLNVLAGKGFLQSDKALLSPPARDIVQAYARDELKFFKDFTNAMVKMGGIETLLGAQGEVRQSCRKINEIQDCKLGDASMCGKSLKN
ncbi:Peroxidase [Thalictrum thalictroides]|uniref:Peroxidase n=1 Tax=Thalictrum thalictroides TaxID=46969 RepID=A0A7J6UXW9_THATH|nr:Peroxidase [Thalictrum thalictroides]